MAEHTCHWPGCNAAVPPAMWGCKRHWFALPARHRAEIWRTYRRGQEVTKTPSSEYLVVARAVQEWIAAYTASMRGQNQQAAAPAEEHRPYTGAIPGGTSFD